MSSNELQNECDLAQLAIDSQIMQSNLTDHTHRYTPLHTHTDVHPHLLLCLLAGASKAPRHAIDKDNNGRRAPAKGNQPFDELLLRNECSHQHRVQIETLAQHPRVVGQQKIVQYDVQRNAVALEGENRK